MSHLLVGQLFGSLVNYSNSKCEILIKPLRGELLNYSCPRLHEISINCSTTQRIQVTSSLFSFSQVKLKLLKPAHARLEKNPITHSGAPTIPLLIQNCGGFSPNKRDPSTCTSTCGRALLLPCGHCSLL